MACFYQWQDGWTMPTVFLLTPNLTVYSKRLVPLLQRGEQYLNGNYFLKPPALVMRRAAVTCAAGSDPQAAFALLWGGQRTVGCSSPPLLHASGGPDMTKGVKLTFPACMLLRHSSVSDGPSWLIKLVFVLHFVEYRVRTGIGFRLQLTKLEVFLNFPFLKKERISVSTFKEYVWLNLHEYECVVMG